MPKKLVFMTGRSRWLASLTSEHIEGLQFTDRIRLGLNNNIDIETLKDYVFWYWRTHIRPHFRHEEEVLLPYFHPGNKLAQRMRNEHDMIWELVICLNEDADHRILTLFADLIQDHILFEENELYLWLERELMPEQLEKIQSRLEQKPIVIIDDWKLEFWLDLKKNSSKRTG